MAELDHNLHEDFEFAEESLWLDPNGSIQWSPSRYRHDPSEQDPGRWVEVWAGGLLAVRYPDDSSAPQIPAPPSRIAEGYSSHELEGDRHVRVLQRPHRIGGTETVIRAVRSEERVDRELAMLFLVLALALPLAVGGAAAGGYLIAQRALHPVGHMARHARRISADRLGERLPIDNPEDELGQLAATFNETFARLERSFEQLKQFTADASHELRTPLTALRTVGEVGLRPGQGEAHLREVIGSMLEETDRMTQLVESLLTLARADSGHPPLSSERMEVRDLAMQVIAHLGPLADEKSQILSLAPGSEEVSLNADRTRLRQALINLIDNAIKYTPAHGTIAVHTRRSNGNAIIEVTDSGPGIAEEHRAKVFDRFYRADPSRTRQGGGFGLGLAIARWAVESQGGRIELDSQVGRGSTFRVVMPLGTESGTTNPLSLNPPPRRKA
jgi:heavy metal sensor kinase